MSIVVIGGSGFIGTHLTKRLLELGHRIAIFDKAPSAAYPGLVTLGDVRDTKAVAQALADSDCVIDLAAEHRDDVRPESRYFDVNVGGAENVTRAATLHRVRRIVFVSTVAVYGLKQPGADESAAIVPFNAYGESKARAEEVYLRWTQAASDRALLTLRPVVVFGEGNRGNVYNLIEQVRRRRLLLIGDGGNRKSVAYVGNLIEFICSRLDMLPGTQLYNYADTPHLSIRELVVLISNLLSVRVPKVAVPYPIGLAAGYLFDVLARLRGRPFAISSVRVRKFCANTQVSARALEQSGFTRPHTLEQGFARMIHSLDEPAQSSAAGESIDSPG